MKTKLLYRAGRVLGIIILAGVAIIGIAAFDVWYQNSYKSLVQILDVPKEGVKFILLTDISGFEDRAWYVYLLPSGLALTSEIKEGHNNNGALFWNYSEAGDHYDEPRIDILKGRYLVFKRGGLYHSLYDLKQKSVLVNDESPWGSFLNSEQYKKYGEESPDVNDGTAMDVWVKENLHKKIELIVNDAT